MTVRFIAAAVVVAVPFLVVFVMAVRQEGLLLASRALGAVAVLLLLGVFAVVAATRTAGL